MKLKLQLIVLGLAISLGWLGWTLPTLSSPISNSILESPLSRTAIGQWDDIVTLEQQSPEYQEGFENGLSAYRSSTSSSAESEQIQSEDYQNGYRDGFEYANGFSVGQTAAQNGGSSFPENNASTSYIDGYREGFATAKKNN